MELFITIFTAVANLVLGLSTYLKNPKSSTHRLLAFLALQISIWSVLNYISLHVPTEAGTLFWIRIDMLPGAPMAPTIFLLVNTFPKKTVQVSQRLLSFIIGLIALTLILAMSPYMFTSVIFEGKNIHAIPGPAIAVFALNFIGFLILSFITLIKRFLASHGLEKAQLRFLIFGLTTTFTLIAVFNLLSVILFHTSAFIAFGPLYSLVLIGSISYAIVKHRFLDIRLLVARTVAYSLLILVLGLIYSIGLFTIGSLFIGTDTSFYNIGVSTFLALIMALSFQPIKRFFENLTDKIFFKSMYDPNLVLSDLSKIMASNIRLDNLTHDVLAYLITSLRITQAAFILTSNDLIVDIKSEGYETTPAFDDIDISLLSKANNSLIFEELEESPSKDILRKLDISAVIHLRTEGKLIGLLVLGSKESGDIYSNQDLSLLEILAPEAAIAIQNSLAYEEIRRFNITLQEEVDKATTDLQSANEKLVVLDKIKDDFVSLASHELRTPMTAIKSYTWLVLNDKDDHISDKARLHLDRVLSSTERLIHLVNEMLDVSRIESGKIQLKLEQFSLAKLFQEVCDEFTAKAAEQKINMACPLAVTLPDITADQEKIHQVLENLIGNALKFTPDNGTITLSAVLKNAMVEISVSDTGPGINTEDLPKLFQKFGRLENSLIASKGPSTGLGLFLCKQYVELHKGQIWATSEVGHGTTFTFSLPL